MKIFVISSMMITLFSLTACSSTVSESNLIAPNDHHTDFYVPVNDKDVSESDQIVEDEFSEAYPNLEPEYQNQEVDVLLQNTAYPEPESDEVPVVEGEDSQKEAYPVPQEEPTQVIKPTPRGNYLVATNPSTINLSSGKLQLVELFAFW
jgi:hypothetical protein